MARKKKKKTGKPDYRISYLFFALGAICLGLGAWAAYQGALTWRWPKTQAQVVDAKLSRYERMLRDDNRRDIRHTFGVHYFYTVDGKAYLGDLIEPYTLGMQNSAGAKKMAERYRPGAKVDVVYNPQRAGEAYLMPGPSSFSLMLLGIGAFFGLLGMLSRRMIRVGPGDDEDELEPPKAEPKTKVSLDPEIASYYPKPGEARTPQ